MRNILIKADSVVQGLLLLSILLSSPTIFAPLILLALLGGWQLGSALIKGIAWRSRLHLTYFGLAAVYCLALQAGISGAVSVNFSSPTFTGLWDNITWVILFVVAIPIVGAVKYCKISYDDCQHYERKLV